MYIVQFKRKDVMNARLPIGHLTINANDGNNSELVTRSWSITPCICWGGHSTLEEIGMLGHLILEARSLSVRDFSPKMGVIQ